MDEAVELPKHRILIVDDTRAAAFILARLLQSLGQHVESCYDGECALEMARKLVPDFIFSDIAMPQLDGYQLARRLRADPALKHITLVALTGYGDENDRRLTREAGFDHHLVKPVSMQALRAVLTGKN